MKEKEIDLYMEFAASVAKRSHSNRLKVGAVIAKKNGIIISYGWNGMPVGMDNCCEVVKEGSNPPVLQTKPEVIHAEMNAILKAAREGRSCEGAWLFLTHKPCDQCLKHIVQSGITNIVFGEVYASASGGNASGEEMMKVAGINCYQYGGIK